MATISVRVDQDIKQRLGRVAELAGMSQNAIVREAIYDMIEELEDFHIVKERMAKPFRSVSNDQVWRELSMED
jgi:predicted DNA-binding protein